LDSPLVPSVLCLLLHVYDRSWWHDVRTKFPSRVIHTPPPAGASFSSPAWKDGGFQARSL
jgi:hypothetical protein